MRAWPPRRAVEVPRRACTPREQGVREHALRNRHRRVFGEAEGVLGCCCACGGPGPAGRYRLSRARAGPYVCAPTAVPHVAWRRPATAVRRRVRAPLQSPLSPQGFYFLLARGLQCTTDRDGTHRRLCEPHARARHTAVSTAGPQLARGVGPLVLVRLTVTRQQHPPSSQAASADAPNPAGAARGSCAHRHRC